MSMPIEAIVHLKLEESYVCGDPQCKTVSNCNTQCPSCFSKTTHVAKLLDSEATRIAHQIAEESAKSDIEAFGVWGSETETGRWYGLELSVAEVQEHLELCAKYLEMRGMLTRSANNPLVVTWESK